MNERNHFEKQLRAWAPRRPSARLRARIFEKDAPRPSVALSQPWLAPAVACALLLVVVSTQRNSADFDSAQAGPGLLAAAPSNPSPASYLAIGFDAGRNSPSADTFEWTNGSRSNSSMGFRLATKVKD